MACAGVVENKARTANIGPANLSFITLILEQPTVIVASETIKEDVARVVMRTNRRWAYRCRERELQTFEIGRRLSFATFLKFVGRQLSVDMIPSQGKRIV